MFPARKLSPGGPFSYGRYMGAQRTVRETWRRHIVGLLDHALERNDGAISAVAAAITTTILAGRHIYAFGAGHSLALVSEMHRRAGSMKVVRPLWQELRDEVMTRLDTLTIEDLCLRAHRAGIAGEFGAKLDFTI